MLTYVEICWHIPITAGCLSMSHKSLQVSRVFAIFTILFANQMNIVTELAKTDVHEINLFVWFEKITVCEKHRFWSSRKLVDILCWSFLWHKVWGWVHKSVVPEDDLNGYMVCHTWNVIAIKFFHQREFFSKVIYLWTYTVIGSLFLAIIKNTYIIKSVCKFTKIELLHRIISMIFYISTLKKTYTFTSSSSLKPGETLISIPFCYTTSKFT